MKARKDIIEELKTFDWNTLDDADLIDAWSITKSPPKYDSNFGDDRICKCGHPYYRHFDTYENMRPVGCKYCLCYMFKEKTDD